MQFFKENYLIWVIAVAIGILMIAPSFYFHYFDPAYRGIEFFGSDAEPDYLSQIQEIYDGHWSSGNIYLADQKDSLYLQQNLSPIIVALLGKILGLSAIAINMAAKFFFPALLTILLYAFFKDVFGRKDLAILMAVFIMLTQATWAFLNPASWPAILLEGKFPGTDSNFLTYARPINPQVSSFFFFGYLLCIWNFLFKPITEKSKKIPGILSAVILGLSFYTYFFTFSFLLAINGLLGLWFLFIKDRQSLKNIIYVSLGALIIGLPYLINLFKVLNSPFYNQASKIQGALDSRQFIFSRVWWGVTALFAFLYKGSKQTKFFILIFLAAAFLVTNQQLITGTTVPVPAHYHWYYIAPVGGAILLYLFFSYLEKIVSLFASRLVMMVILSIFLYAGFLFQKNSYFTQRDSFVSVQRYADALFWLKDNISKPSVILSNDTLSSFLVGYTHHNVYGDRHITNFLVSPERIKDFYYTDLFLKGVTQSNAEDFFLENKDSVGNQFFGQYYRQKNGCYGCFPDDILKDFIDEYKVFSSGDFLIKLKKYPLDYIVWDKEKDPLWKMDRFFIKKVYDKGNIIIYSAY